MAAELKQFEWYLENLNLDNILIYQLQKTTLLESVHKPCWYIMTSLRRIWYVRPMAAKDLITMISRVYIFLPYLLENFK